VVPPAQPRARRGQGDGGPYDGDYSKSKEFARYDAALQIGSVYRVILRVLDPGFLIKKSGSLWNRP
jgi:hypothetical protein